MFKIEFPLRDGLGSNDATSKVLLNSFRGTQFQVIGMQSFDSSGTHVTHCENRERATVANEQTRQNLRVKEEEGYGAGERVRGDRHDPFCLFVMRCFCEPPSG